MLGLDEESDSISEDHESDWEDRDSEDSDPEQDNMCYISKLPAEMLTSIFLACTQLNNADWAASWYQGGFMSETSPPLVFLAVCRQWRQLASGNPALWSTLRACTNNLNDICMMSRWLRFADKQPLSIRLFTEVDDSADAIADLAVDVLMEHQEHWLHVEFNWEIGTAAPLLAHTFAPAHHALLLQTFRIFTHLGLDPHSQNVVDVRLGRLLAGSPDLRAFEWSYIVPGRPASPIHLLDIPFSNLRHLKLGCRMIFSCCIDILSRMPLLESCELANVSVSRSMGHNHATTDALRLQHLQSLCIKTNTDMSSFLDNLILPSLRRIEIVFRLFDVDEPDGPDEEENLFEHSWPHAEFLSFLQRSACPLEELDLVTSVTEDELVQYLSIVSSTLHTLFLRGKLGWASIDHHALSMLTAFPEVGERVLCPNLRTIRLDDCIVNGQLPNGCVADMIQSRLIHAVATKSERPLEIYLAAPRNFIDLDDWRRLYVLSKRSEGRLKISLLKLPERVASE
ncbi:hypothetical protein HWV62_8339 [Athelia sp. TMB]|nr:hypothetical protein HWV62_8339 [Athelia sp. TMB]